VKRTALALTLALAACRARPVRVGSKNFTEGVLLGEVATRACAATGARVEHRRQLGGTAVLWRALRAGSIDAYAEYTGTLTAELVRGADPTDLPGLRRALAAEGVAMTDPLGFENTYALGLPESVAAARGITTVTDLRAHPELSLALSHEFVERADGWPGLRRAYGLSPREVRGMDHDLAYRALASGAAHVTDLYSTDAEIASYRLRVLRDDRHYFPDYRAVILYRSDLRARSPACARALDALAGRVDAPTMIAMNAAVRLSRRAEADVAAEFLATRLRVGGAVAEPSRFERIAARTREHLALVLASLLAAVACAVPLGVFAARRPRVGALVLAAAGVLQTVPSLALLVLLIPLLGIGAGPAVAALFLYALLPVVQNTVTGLRGIAPSLRESAEALGLPPRAVLLRVELPLALPSILAGVRTAAVISVGTATLGALVGAGGYGQPIMTGIRLDATGTILEGAVPAALLALVTQGVFGWAERRLVPKGLRGG
jgi:osmoprotectant transport system permease protein